MNCLLAAATTKEIEPFLQYYRKSDNKQDIDIVVTGIGLMATTYALCKQISLKKPGLIIQAGIAGCFDKNIPLGSVVVVKQDRVADLGVVENNQLKTMFDLGFIKPNKHPYTSGWLQNPHKDLIKTTGLNAVKALSVNQITTSKKMIKAYEDSFATGIESMEGAALHYVCLMENIPFLQIRSISNYIGERNKAKWKIKEAVLNLDKELNRIITTLNPKS